MFGMSKEGWVSAKCSYRVRHTVSSKRLQSKNFHVDHFRQMCLKLYLCLSCSAVSVASLREVSC